MKRDPVLLDPDQRKRALDEIVASLQRRNIEIAAASVHRLHKHVLARFPDHNPRRWWERSDVPTPTLPGPYDFDASLVIS